MIKPSGSELHETQITSEIDELIETLASWRTEDFSVSNSEYIDGTYTFTRKTSAEQLQLSTDVETIVETIKVNEKKSAFEYFIKYGKSSIKQEYKIVTQSDEVRDRDDLFSPRGIAAVMDRIIGPQLVSDDWCKSVYTGSVLEIRNLKQGVFYLIMPFPENDVSSQENGLELYMPNQIKVSTVIEWLKDSNAPLFSKNQHQTELNKETNT